MPKAESRSRLLQKIAKLADVAIFGTAAESYRTCGNPGCRCHGEGPKHGPHLYVSYRGESGKTVGYYVPKAAVDDVRRGIEAWHEVQECLKQLAEINKDGALARARKERSE